MGTILRNLTFFPVSVVRAEEITGEEISAQRLRLSGSEPGARLFYTIPERSFGQTVETGRVMGPDRHCPLGSPVCFLASSASPCCDLLVATGAAKGLPAVPPTPQLGHVSGAHHPHPHPQFSSGPILESLPCTQPLPRVMWRAALTPQAPRPGFIWLTRTRVR